MGKTIRIRRGFDIKLEGAAEKTITDLDLSDVVALQPPDFPLVIPKLLVEPGAEVLAGQSLFFDKNRPDIHFPAPVSGEVTEIVRGEKRRILEIRILPDKSGTRYVEYSKLDPGKLERHVVVERLLESGCWNYIRQRPYSEIADPKIWPKAIFVSCFDSAPLAPDLEFIIAQEPESFQVGLKALEKLADGKLHLGLRSGQSDAALNGVPADHIHRFSGPHPAGNVGIQIHHIDPIRKGEAVWYVHPQDVIIIGRLFREGRYRPQRIVALTGAPVKQPQYYRMMSGQQLHSLVDGRLNGDKLRVIEGNVLTGRTSSADDFLSFYVNHITVLPEGDKPEFMGWLMPGLNKLSLSRTFFSWLMPNRTYQLDTNTHGEERAYVMTGEYERVLPMDILPVYLIKAIMSRDIERMEQLGIYEVSEEDFALCEFVCTSKMDVQQIIAEGLAFAKKEG